MVLAVEWWRKKLNTTSFFGVDAKPIVVLAVRSILRMKLDMIAALEIATKTYTTIASWECAVPIFKDK